MRDLLSRRLAAATGFCLIAACLLYVLSHSRGSDGRVVVVHARPSIETNAASAEQLIALNNDASATATTQIDKSTELKAAAAVGTLMPRQDLLWKETPVEAPYARFQDWVHRWEAAESAAKPLLEEEGIRLADFRRQALRELIVTNPERALVLGVPVGVENSLPASVRSLLEKRLSGKGSLDVFGALAETGHEQEVTPTFRKAHIGGRTYDAYVYGRRLGEPTRHDIVLNGLAVDDRFAVNENPVRVLDPEQAASRLPNPTDAVCAVSGNPATANNTPVVADAGGETFVLCGPSHALNLNQQILEAEIAAAGAQAGSGAGPTIAASARTEGTKKLILIRVDFSDIAGAPFTDTAGATLISGLNDFYMEQSYGRSGFYLDGDGSTITTTLRMPQTAAYYGANDAYLQLRSDARAAATAAGYTLGSYDHDLICFGAVPGWGWAGLGYVGAAGVWLRNYFTVGVAGHELGHNFGLNHANFWDTGNQSTIGTGTSVEYGDNLDTMGSANGGSYHFNARYKSYLNWLRSDEVTNVTASGTYRIFSHDNPTSTGLRALRIARNSTTNYWVEFRQKFTSNPWLMNGAGIRWAGNGNERSHLLDTTPGSPNGKTDAALVVGRTFMDSDAGIYITTLRMGGTSPESLDVAVNFGPFVGNANPVVTLNAASTTTSAGSTLGFTADASDANGDSLAYYWDFGDGTFGTNGAAASKSWSSSGQFVVRCVVTDMKGGEASDSVLVTVGSPGTYTLSGRIASNGSPLEGVRVSVTSQKVTYTDSDGTYTLAGLSAGSYTVSVFLSGYTFTAVGFSNPVFVGPSQSGIDWTGEGGSPTGGTANLTSPVDGTTYLAPANVTLAATATASLGQILSKVEYYQGATKLGEDLTSPYTFTWGSVPAGVYALTARSVDTLGLSATSSIVNITVNPRSPTITLQPQSQTISAGGNATFTVGVSGSAPFAYRWRLNGTNIPGGVNSSLSLNNVQPLQAGSYSVIVTNAAGAVTSSSANLMVNCSFTLSANSRAFGSDGGDGSVDVTTEGGCSWTVSGVPSWITITSGNGGSGDGSVSYTVAPNTNSSSRNATVDIGGRSYTISEGAPDFIRPTVAFNSPASGAVQTNLVVTVTGTANDNDGVGRVDYAVGSSPFASATGTEDWSATVALEPGTNLVLVRSVDLSGNISVTNSRGIFCSVPSSLSIAVVGFGSVSGATNGQKLAIGKAFQIKALPTPGYLFSNWTGSVSGTDPTLNFLMQSNLQIVANFVVNPFAGRRGTYNGLFFEVDQVRPNRSGAFTLTLSDRGSYSASVQIGNKKARASGSMGLDGKATNVISRPGTNSLIVNWSVALDDSLQIGGTVGDGTWTANLQGDQAFFNKTNVAPRAGNYTFAMLGSPGGHLAPEGDSYGTVSVDFKGALKWKISLADKTGLAGKAFLSKDGHWPVYASPYGGNGGLLGWITFTNQAASDFEGLISWIKPSSVRTPFFPGGFNSEAALIGASYEPPGDSSSRLLDLTNAVALLTGGNLSVSYTNNVALGLAGKVDNSGPNRLVMKFNLASGLFTGNFTPDGATKAVTFKGVALQKANYATGHFYGTNQSGRFAIEEVPISSAARLMILTQ